MATETLTLNQKRTQHPSLPFPRKTKQNYNHNRIIMLKIRGAVFRMVLTLLAAVPEPGRGIQHCRLLRNLCSTQFLSKGIEILTEIKRIADLFIICGSGFSFFKTFGSEVRNNVEMSRFCIIFSTLVNCLQKLVFFIRSNKAKL